MYGLQLLCAALLVAIAGAAKDQQQRRPPTTTTTTTTTVAPSTEPATSTVSLSSEDTLAVPNSPANSNGDATHKEHHESDHH